MPRRRVAFRDSALDPASNAYPEGYHKGKSTGLTGVEADLVAAKIVSPNQIFGVDGSATSGTATEDILGNAVAANVTATDTYTFSYYNHSLAASADWTVTKTQTYASASLAVGVAVTWIAPDTASAVKVRLIMDGVQVAESGYIAVSEQFQIVIGTKALSGSKDCSCQVHNYSAGTVVIRSISGAAGTMPEGAGIVIGNVKVV